MQGLRIGIVEDEVLIADNISMHLKEMGHQVVGIYKRFDDIISQLKSERMDLLLVDIRLKGAKSGIDVAEQVKERHGIPFLFLTSNTDRNTIDKALKTNPLGYITKPFTFDDLYIAIELAMTKVQMGQPTGRKVEIKNGPQTEWIAVENILYLEAARSYVTIHLKERQMVLRQSMGNLLNLFEKTEMIRIHRGYAVNPNKVESMSTSKAIVEGTRLPIGQSHRDDFLGWMRELKA